MCGGALPLLLLPLLGPLLPGGSGGAQAASAPEVKLEGPWPNVASPVNRARVFVDNATFGGAGPRSGYRFPRYDARLHDGDEVQLESTHKTWVSFTTEPLYTLRGRTLALRAADGRYCAVPAEDPEGVVRCDQIAPPFSAWFQVEGQQGSVTLKDRLAQRYCADAGFGFRCDGVAISKNQLLAVVDAGGGKIALRSGGTGLFCADDGLGLTCDRDTAEGTAQFDPVTDTPVKPCAIHTPDQSIATTFVVRREEGSNGTVALLCKDVGMYLMVAAADGTLSCSSAEPWPILATRAAFWDARVASFSSPETGLYVQAGDLESSGEKVTAANQEATGWALWSILLRGGFETVRPLVRGVNLGNWLILESWMAQELFRDPSGQKDFAGECAPLDEYALMRALGPQVAKRRMEQHWASWITEEDIIWLAGHGINAVRVPFGFWAVEPEPPFIPGQLRYLDLLFEWCERHSIAVMLDFHGLKGSQTGTPTSGNCGGCGRDTCGRTSLDFLEEQRINLHVIRTLSARFSKSPAYLGFEVANEVSELVDPGKIMAFYQRAYSILRADSADALVIVANTFRPSTFPFPDFTGAVEDIHIYFGVDFGEPTADQHKNLERARKAVAGSHWNVLVGEWSLGASGHHTAEWGPAKRDHFFRAHARMQLQSWEKHTGGWFYWNYKTNYFLSTWNFRDMCEVGWLPGCQPGFQYASAEWWRQPDCAFAYLDGACAVEAPAASVGAKQWPVALAAGAAMAAVAGAAVAVGVRKPKWVTAVRAAVTTGAAEGASRTRAAAQTAMAAASPWVTKLSAHRSDCQARPSELSRLWLGSGHQSATEHTSLTGATA